MPNDPAKKRCTWVRGDNPLMLTYHDREWGVPVHDDRTHFEFLILEGAQAGLSWTTILNKRESYRKAFDNFDPAKVARFTATRIEKLLQNPGIIRNRLKIESSVRNAKAFLKLQKEFGSFDSYSWRFVDGEPKLNKWKSMQQIPATSSSAASTSSARPSSTPTCRPSAWSTITSPIASAIASFDSRQASTHQFTIVSRHPEAMPTLPAEPNAP